MKKYLFILICFLITACDSGKIDAPSTYEKDRNGAVYKVKEIDRCEYIEVQFGSFEDRVYSLTHKGNCKNPIHRMHQ
ncbi:hypothetical protein GCM10028806_33280 [Spirosoma terrae]|uniref:Uncharacterized protein n=1 Tax=Spirosoma terrae TaxID=1968276 RepID=A0A6L9L578_9BACT|nr:hypothetical protein [Spirosoma terrae]NDU95644.1 hypothetical protein [Spirosoma terrae]